MSMRLGPIHFWLYDKIHNQEKLTKEIAHIAKTNGWLADVQEYINDLQPLETVIDESNIHGWLQSRIDDAEYRYANLIDQLQDYQEKLKTIAYTYGKENSILKDKDVIVLGVNAETIYKYFEDFFVNGMPCDRVNTIASQTEDTLEWNMNRDIHAQYWKNQDASTYYSLRNCVMDGMLDQTPYQVEMINATTYTITKKIEIERI